jgi:hypothetical protein
MIRHLDDIDTLHHFAKDVATRATVAVGLAAIGVTGRAPGATRRPKPGIARRTQAA